MTQTNRTRSIVRELLSALWQQPLWAVPFALFFGTLGGSSWGDYVEAYKYSLVFAYCIRFALLPVIAFYIPSVQCSEIAHTARGRVQIMGALALAAMTGSYTAMAIIHFTIKPGFLGDARAMLVAGMFTLVFFTLFTGIHMAIMYYRQSVERAKAVEVIRAELAQAELRALRAQINPHFLFNTLNSIAALIATNPAAAEDTTTRLADVFRYSLRASEREQSRLEDELGFVRSYLEIERTRFGDRLHVEESIEPGLASALVPSLLLQPLVENAVRYAVSPREEGGRVRLSARRTDDTLILEVSDDGPGMHHSPQPAGTGFGLHSVRERLRAAGHAQALTVDSVPGRGTRIEITLPLTTAPASTVAVPQGGTR